MKLRLSSVLLACRSPVLALQSSLHLAILRTRFYSVSSRSCTQLILSLVRVCADFLGSCLR
eukprot:1601949-Pleurochrysis_carterae.AAC.2